MGDDDRTNADDLPEELRELTALLEERRLQREKKRKIKRTVGFAGLGLIAGQALYSAGRWAYRKATQQGPTGLELVGGFAPELATEVTTALHAEDTFALQQDHSLAFLRLAASVERVVRDGVYLAGRSLTPHVIEGLSADKKAAIGLEKATRSRPKEPTLWVLRLWLRGLGAALAGDCQPVRDWVSQAYAAPADVPYSDWAAPRRVLTDSRLPEFLGELGDERNRHAHGRGGAPMSGEEWTSWCKRTLGSSSLEPWLACGASPADHRPDDGAWMSRLLLFMPRAGASGDGRMMRQ